MLAVDALVVSYGAIQALRGVSLTVGRGEYVGVIGPNGAGKTTLLLALSGALSIAGGRVALDGEDLARVPQHQRVGRGIAIVPEGREVFGPLSVLENLELGAYHRRRTAPRAEVRADLEMVLELFPVLRQRVRQLAATLSGGEQQMLAVGRALMSRPRLLPDPHDCAAERGQHLLGALALRGRAGRQHDERALFRRPPGPEHGCVDEGDVVLAGKCGEALRGGQSYCGRLGPERARLEHGQRLLHGLLDGRPVGEHG